MTVETLAVGMPAAVSSALTAVVTSVLAVLGIDPTRAPSRAAAVMTLDTMMARPNSTVPRIRVISSGATTAISTAAAPRRGAHGWRRVTGNLGVRGGFGAVRA